MGIEIGGIDLAESALNTEFRVAVLERIIDKLVSVSPLILREAARLRSQWPRLRSPDAIHAATALSRFVQSSADASTFDSWACG